MKNIIFIRTGSIVKARFEIVQYSDKAIAVFGQGTYHIRNLLLKLKGKFNKNLKYENDKSPGWIFPSYMEKKVVEQIQSLETAKLFMKMR